MTSSGGFEIPDDTSGVLASLRTERSEVNAGEVRELRLAVAWAAMHSGDTLVGPPSDWSEHEVDLGGEGAPKVTEFCVPELAMALGTTHDGGARYLGDAIDLAHRLPRTYRRVLSGELRVWKARRIAQQTRCLPQAGAAYVDAHVAHVAHTIGPAALDRVIDRAVTLYDPALAEERRKASAEHRRFDIRLGDTAAITAGGTVQVDGTLDYADALDLEAAVAQAAEALAALGSTDPLGVRRAAAVGELARRQFAFDLNPGTPDPAAKTEPGTGTTPRERTTPAKAMPSVKPRRVVIHVHLTDAAIASATSTACTCGAASSAGAKGDHPLVRVENMSSAGGFLFVDQVADWCADPATQVVLQPVIDLNTMPRTDAYEIPDRIRAHVVLRDRTCVFPGCNVNARRCDLDHAQPHAEGGDTCVCNLAPLCRRHHRLKTHGGWTYRCLAPGVYEWTTPHGHTYQTIHRQHHHDPPADEHPPGRREA